MCTSAWLRWPVRVFDECVHCVLKYGPSTYARRRCRGVAPSSAAILTVAKVSTVTLGHESSRKIWQMGMGTRLRRRLSRLLLLLAEFLQPFARTVGASCVGADCVGASCVARWPPRPRLCPLRDHF